MKYISDSNRLSLSTLDQSRPFSSVDKTMRSWTWLKFNVCMYIVLWYSYYVYEAQKTCIIFCLPYLYSSTIHVCCFATIYGLCLCVENICKSSLHLKGVTNNFIPKAEMTEI